jgi:hypothetical protein
MYEYSACFVQPSYSASLDHPTITGLVFSLHRPSDHRLTYRIRVYTYRRNWHLPIRLSKSPSPLLCEADLQRFTGLPFQVGLIGSRLSQMARVCDPGATPSPPQDQDWDHWTASAARDGASRFGPPLSPLIILHVQQRANPVQCDEQKPSCQSCVRRCAGCIYRAKKKETCQKECCEKSAKCPYLA